MWEQKLYGMISAKSRGEMYKSERRRKLHGVLFPKGMGAATLLEVACKSKCICCLQKAYCERCRKVFAIGSALFGARAE